jgi:Fe-S cluster assembly ATP-binding protein
MMLLEPSFCILDETDSGLDVDALKIVAEGVNAMRSKDRSILIITHYQRLLELIKPDYVHVLSGGTITKSGDHTLAEDLDKRGFDWVTLARDSNAKS